MVRFILNTDSSIIFPYFTVTQKAENITESNDIPHHFIHSYYAFGSVGSQFCDAGILIEAGLSNGAAALSLIVTVVPRAQLS